MLGTQRTVVIAAVIAVFFILLLQCLTFMRTPDASNAIKETFVTTSAGPTRPDDCLCLPGYVPSNAKGNSLAGSIIRQNNKAEWYFIPSGTRTAYWIPACRINGIDVDFCAKYQPRMVTASEFKSLVDTFDKTLTASLWNELHATTTTPVFFCQRLTDATDVKACTVIGS